MRPVRALAAVLLLAGCAAPGAVSREPPLDDVSTEVRDAETLARAGLYPGALQLLEGVARRPPTTPDHDRALFALGRLLVLPDNPGRDYRRALGQFDRLLLEHPRSAYAADARAWRALLVAYLAKTQELDRLKRLDVELERPRPP